MKQKIISSIFLIFAVCAIVFVFFSNEKNNQSFYLPDTESHKLIKIPDEEVLHIKSNIYSYNGSLYLAGEYSKKRAFGEYEIRNVYMGLQLYKKINENLIVDAVDVETYEEIKPYFLYKDVQNVYIFIRENGCHRCLNVLSQKADSFQVLDKHYEYGKDNEAVYCLRNGKEIPTQSKFHITELGGISFGFDSQNIYSMCEAVSANDFLSGFENISQSAKESFLKTIKGL